MAVKLILVFALMAVGMTDKNPVKEPRQSYFQNYPGKIDINYTMMSLNFKASVLNGTANLTAKEPSQNRPQNYSRIVEELNSSIVSFRNELALQKSTVGLLKNELALQKSKVEQCLENLTSQFNIFNSHSFDFAWKIERFSQKQKLTLHSNPFYVSKYKMGVQLNVNGNGTHLSLYSGVYFGDWDAILTWPVEYKGKFILYDQVGNKHETKDIVVNKEDCSKYKNVASKRHCFWGFPQCFPLDKLKPPYLVNDTIYVGFKGQLFPQ